MNARAASRLVGIAVLDPLIARCARSRLRAPLRALSKQRNPWRAALNLILKLECLRVIEHLCPGPAAVLLRSLLWMAYDKECDSSFQGRPPELITRVALIKRFAQATHDASAGPVDRV